MSCRTTAAGSAFTTFARLNAGGVVSDVATLSAFHALRADWRRMRQGDNVEFYLPEVSVDNYRRLLVRETELVEGNQNLSEARRVSLANRLQSAAEGEIPDEATIYALSRINTRMLAERNGRNALYSAYAEALGVTPEEAANVFTELENGIDRSRSAGNPETYTTENIEGAVGAGLGEEAGSVHAYTVMRERMHEARSSRDVSGDPPQRIVRELFHDNPLRGSRSGFGGGIREMGYDRRSGRLEIVIESDYGQIVSEAYRNIPVHVWDRMVSSNAMDVFATSIRNRGLYQYPDQETANQGALAPRCSICGQFANNQHSCPPEVTPAVRSYDLSGFYGTRTSQQRVLNDYVDRYGNVRQNTIAIPLPLVADLRSAAQAGSVQLTSISAGINTYTNAEGGFGDNYARVTGEVAYVRDNDGNQTLNSSNLSCSCVEFRTNGTCRHIGIYVEALTTRLTPPIRLVASLTPEERAARTAERAAEAQRKFEEASSSDWTRNAETLAEAKRTWRNDSEVLYSENPEKFKEHYAAAVAAIDANNGKAAVPYIRQNALGGMATRESGQAFGMEIEYDFPNDWTSARKSEANIAIGLALKEANLTSTERQQGYHAAQRSGYTDKHVNDEGKGTWSWESDGSVSGGELVTPGMYDEPETWEKLEKAVSIIKEHGGEASARAGAHVHVGTGFYNGDPGTYGELARLMTQHEDVMFRLAQNPERGNHRQGHYTTPLNDAPPAGWSSVAAVRNWQGTRTRVLNFNGVADGVRNTSPALSDHPEFRIFDSTLDIGVMQTQIKTAVAMTHAAARNGELGSKRGKEKIGAHFARAKARGRRRPTEEEFLEDTATFRSFVDTLFSREEDKKQVTALFAATKWCKPDAHNRH